VLPLLIRHVQRHAALVVCSPECVSGRRLDQGKGVTTVHVHRHANGMAGVGRRGEMSGSPGRVAGVCHSLGASYGGVKNLEVLLIATAATRNAATEKKNKNGFEHISKRFSAFSFYVPAVHTRPSFIRSDTA
jgi:hypothetical protein